eukprot:gene29098-38160_t
MRPFEAICASDWDVIYASEKKIIHLLQQLEAKNRQIQSIEDSLKTRDEVCDTSVNENFPTMQEGYFSSVVNFEGKDALEIFDPINSSALDKISVLNGIDNTAEVQSKVDQTDDFRKKYLDASNELEALRSAATELRQSNSILVNSLQAVTTEKDFLSQQLVSYIEKNDKDPLIEEVAPFSVASSQDENLSTTNSDLALLEKLDKSELEELRMKYSDATNELLESQRGLEDLQQRYTVLEQSLQVVTSSKCSLSLQVGIFETKIAAYERTISDLERDLRSKEDELQANLVAASPLEVTDHKADSPEVAASKTGSVINDLREKLSKALGMKHSKDAMLQNGRAHYETATAFTQTDFPPQDPSCSLPPHASHSSLNHLSQSNTPAMSRRSSFTLSASEKVYVTPKIRDPDQEALETGLLLSQQQAEFGINMLDALRPEDEPTVQQLMLDGLSREEAAFFLFRERFILPTKEQSKDNTQSREVKIMAMPHLQRTASVASMVVGDTFTAETADYSDSHGGREIQLHRTMSTTSNLSNSSGGWIDPSSDFDVPADTYHRRSGPWPLTSRHGAGADDETVNWHHNKIYQTPSTANTSIANRQTPKPVYSNPNSNRRSNLMDDQLLLTRQLYQSPAEALHAINQRRKSRELLLPSNADMRERLFDIDEEYSLSIDLLMRKHSLSRRDATDLYWRRLRGNRTVFSQQF